MVEKGKYENLEIEILSKPITVTISLKWKPGKLSVKCL
jgi:hypothetical protein